MSSIAPAPDAGLADWLAYLDTLHPKPIDLGLERIRTVAQRLDVRLDCVKITVAGTNGKGSTCAMLESILLDAGYQVGQYTSPHLLRFNERIRVNGVEASDADIVAQLARIEAARGDTTLTYFEMTTLAALLIFQAARLDVVVLEVGLGGRLDAVNLIDTDCAILTSVDLDHMAYLGNTREAIGWEKAHIFRPGKPAICADPCRPRRSSTTPPRSVPISGASAPISTIRATASSGLMAGAPSVAMRWAIPRCAGPTSCSMPPRHWRHSKTCATVWW
ncbi:hypothetical protein CCAE64S_02736 [Castellaniella caeni]